MVDHKKPPSSDDESIRATLPDDDEESFTSSASKTDDESIRATLPDEDDEPFASSASKNDDESIRATLPDDDDEPFTSSASKTDDESTLATLPDNDDDESEGDAFDSCGEVNPAAQTLVDDDDDGSAAPGASANDANLATLVQDDAEESEGGNRFDGGTQNNPAAKTLSELLTIVDDDDERSPTRSGLSIVATIVGEGGDDETGTYVDDDDGNDATGTVDGRGRRPHPATVVSAEDVEKNWGAVSHAGRSSCGATMVQVADPRTGLTTDLDVALRPGRLALGQPDPSAGSDFVISSQLGKGGMGAVFRAKQHSLGREVAIKVILPDHAAKERSRVKFIAEAVITGALDHPNIIPLHELGVTDEGLPFYAMKEVRGTPWSKVIREKSDAENVGILLAVADAVAFAHDRGFIHRDLKPENVMLGGYGEVLLMDWGLAVPHFPDAQGKHIPKGRAGTPAYLAPEMARADDTAIGPASDIYLLGAILYEIVSGAPPHGGESVFACIAMAANNVIEPTDRDDELVAIALRAMATRPEDRYSTVKEFQAALSEYRRHEESLTLCAHARERLVRAREGGDYEDYNRAIFGFDEALVLWDANAAARSGRREARLALAAAALGRGDSDLALSTVAAVAPGEDAEFDRARADAEKQKREVESRRLRVRRMRRAVAVMVAAVVLVLSVATVWVNRARELAVEARDEAERSEARAKTALASESAALAEKTKALSVAEEARRAEADARRAEVQALQKANAEMAAREQERRLREDAEMAARTSEELLARAGYLENSERWTFPADVARARQAEAAAAAGHAARRVIPLPGGQELALLCVPPGEYVMGSPSRESGRSSDEPLHPVVLTRPLWLARTPLTRGQWRALVPPESAEELGGGGLSELLGAEDAAESWGWRTRELAEGEGDLPATGISPLDARDILLPRLARLAPAEWNFRLPTEAEWEYACRAGTATPFYSGPAAADALRAGWLDENSEGAPQAVGRRQANAWGFFDMHGNVMEIVADYYSPVFALTTAAAREDPYNDTMHGGRPLRVVRGGSYFSSPAQARSARRESLHEENRHGVVGLRLALAPAAPPPVSDAQ